MSATTISTTETLVVVGKAGPAGPAGVGIKSGTINAAGHLVFTLSNNATLDVGALPSGTTAGGGGGPQPVLTMPPGITNGEAVTIGTGPNSLVLLLSNNPTTPQPCYVAVLLDGVPIAGPLAVSSSFGYGGGQLFTLHGNWAAANPVVEIVGAGLGDVAIWVNKVTYNLVPLFTQQGGVNQDHYWASQGEAVTFGLPVAVAPPPPPPPPTTLSIISAKLDGKAVSGTLADLAGQMTATSTLVLPAGHFIATALIPGGTITGAPLGANGLPTTTLDCTGQKPTYGKGVLVPNGNCTINNLSLTGATLASPGGGSTSGSYAAGIRENVTTATIVLNHVECYGNDMGIEALGSSYTCNSIFIHDNGMADGYSHECYFQQGPTSAGIVTIAGTSRIVAGPNATHALKSRQFTTQVESGVTISGNGSAAAWCGSVVDVPNGGIFTATEATLVLPAGSANILLLGFGEENNGNAAAGSSASLLNCTLHGMTGKIEANASVVAAATLNVTGTVAQSIPTLAGFVSVAGTIALGA